MKNKKKRWLAGDMIKNAKFIKPQKGTHVVRWMRIWYQSIYLYMYVYIYNYICIYIYICIWNSVGGFPACVLALGNWYCELLSTPLSRGEPQVPVADSLIRRITYSKHKLSGTTPKHWCNQTDHHPKSLSSVIGPVFVYLTQFAMDAREDFFAIRGN